MLAPYLPPFLHYLRFEKRFSPHTLTAYDNDLKQFSDYLATEYPTLAALEDISHHIIRSWLAYIKERDTPAPTSLNRKSASLSAFFRHLMRIDVLESNPVRQLHSQRLPQRLPQFLKEEETGKLMNEYAFGEGFKGATDRLICELLYNTGMRRQELVNLKEDDVEWSLKQLRVLGKGNKERLIPVSEALLDALQDYIAAKKKNLERYDPKALLVLESGQPLYPVYVYRIVQHHLEETGVTLKKKSPHILRHTFATHLLNNGANIQAIKELLGHASLAATQVYTHNNIAQLKEIHKKSHPRG